MRHHPQLLVAGGAILGVWARYAIGDYVSQHLVTAFPVATLTINLVGCLVIGGVQSLFLDLSALGRDLQLFLTVGLLGGFTTFSTFSVETLQLISVGQSGRALGYLLLSLAGGPLAALAGALIVQRTCRALVQREAGA